MADEVESHDVLAQAEALADVTREAGTQVTRASADNHGVDLIRRGSRLAQGALAGLCRQQRGVLRKPGVQHIGVQREGFVQIIHGEAATNDAVVTQSHFFQKRP